jgi:hypothetical protein
MRANATFVCPDGKYSLPGSDSVGDCVCPAFSSSRPNAKYVNECICDAGYFRLYSSQFVIGGWYCAQCIAGQECYNNTNYTCPVHSSSYAMAKSYLDCWCLSGFLNATNRTKENYCQQCPANFFCTGQGAVESCVANAIAPVQSAAYTACFCDLGWKGVNNSACEACQSPTYCYGGIQAQCSEGTYSPSLAWDRLNCSCIAGRWGPTGGPCIVCSAGKYNTFPGCKACTNTTDLDCSLCELGTASTMLGRNTTCDVCAAGKYSYPANQKGAITCEACANGTISGVRASNCTNCLDGTFAVGGASTCTACPAGSFGVGLVSACSSCVAGTYSLGGTTTCTTCPAGTYSTASSAVNSGTCALCTAGKYQTGTGGGQSGVCTSCQAGTYSTGAGITMSAACATCSVCSIGQYNLTTCNASSNIVCGTCSKPITVNAGNFYFTSTGYNGPASCSGYCQNQFYRVGTQCIPCEPNSWCRLDNIYPCPANTASPAGNSYQYNCKCNAGYFGEGGWNSTQAFPGQITPPANWNNVNCEACSAGKYSSATGVSLSNTCLACSAGTYSTVIAAWNSSTCALCKAGTYLTGVGSNQSSACDLCQKGTYSTGTGASLPSVCSACNPGTYSSGTGASQPSTCVSCTGGTFSLQQANTCTTCGPGYFSLNNASACVGCAIGSYNGRNGSGNCSLCEPGGYSFGSASTCTLCGAGKFKPFNGCIQCSESTDSDCLLCTPGSASSVLGRVDACDSCTAGTFSYPSKTPGAITCRNCSNGTYSFFSADECYDCLLGFYALAGSSACTPCPFHTYLDVMYKGSILDCITCAAGKVSPYTGAVSAFACTSCESGKYEFNRVCQPCAAGSYSSSASTACDLCTNGTYSTGSSAACLVCTLGRYAGPGASVCLECPLHTYLDLAYKGSIYDCMQCPSGTFTVTTGNPSSNNCLACPSGKYEFYRACQSCVAGTYSLQQATHCKICPLGSFSGSGASTCTGCPPGSYSELSGQQNCTPCSAGTFSGGAVTVCTDCRPGFFSLVQASVCLTCTPGKYSAENKTEACSLCREGYYSTGGTTGCLFCEYGTFTDLNGTSACAECAHGSFSPQGSTKVCIFIFQHRFSGTLLTWHFSLQCELCLPGTYGTGRLSEAWDCPACGAGRYFTGYGGTGQDICDYCSAGKYSIFLRGEDVSATPTSCASPPPIQSHRTPESPTRPREYRLVFL